MFQILKATKYTTHETTKVLFGQKLRLELNGQGKEGTRITFVDSWN